MSVLHSGQRARPVGALGSNAAVRSLIGACLGMLVNPSSMLLISYGLYVGPIVADTGWDRTVVASAIGPTMLIVGLMSPLIGWATARMGPRRFISLGFPAFGLAMMLLATPTSVSLFALLMALGGVLVAGQTMIPYAYCVSGWFEARRGMALGVMLAFTGLGLALVPPGVVRLLDLLGWRATMVSLGAVVFVVGLVVGRWLIVDPPVAVASDRAQVPGVSWRKALAMPVFWCLALLIFLIGAAAAGGMVNLYAVMTERGVSRQSASFIMSVVGLSMIVARLGFGYLFDRVSAHRVMLLICGLMCVAFAVLGLTSAPAGVVVAAILIGIGFGSEGDALSYMTSRLFGMRDFAKVFGIIFMAFTFGGGAGPVLFALLTRQTGNHQAAIWCAAGACGVAAALASLIQRRHLLFVRNDPRAAPAATASWRGLPHRRDRRRRSSALVGHRRSCTEHDNQPRVQRCATRSSSSSSATDSPTRAFCCPWCCSRLRPPSSDSTSRVSGSRSASCWPFSAC